MSKIIINLSFSLFMLGSLSGCLTNTLVSDRCNQTYPADQQECDKTDAAIYTASALLKDSDKGQSCADMSGKAKEDCLVQQQALRESLDKHSRK
ncbi:hypothetical protein ACE02D_02565 [Shewanella bicestrii]|uniref:Lipoprotein n=1 Tax=Shewanella seohaensis TaxID=755175 RepID=A0ABV4VTQ9_9GAMM|nr:hypothetical protein [Shewanella sp. MR-4]ABI40584.1 hypothetical protein Shewmr4_3518 [Shewanella sp. MR-4]